eukprot:4525420-Prymnesium_polylepis.1
MRFEACAANFGPWSRQRGTNAQIAGGSAPPLFVDIVSGRACVDRLCVRCVARGNANRATASFCAVSGYEALALAPLASPGPLAPTALAPTAASLSLLLAL